METLYVWKMDHNSISKLMMIIYRMFLLEYESGYENYDKKPLT